MLTRVVILFIPALALIVWGIAAQLPRWTAPQPNWFAAGTPGVCAAVELLKRYEALPGESPDGIGREAAQVRAAEIAAEHYNLPALSISEPLGVYLKRESALPPAERLGFYIVTVRFNAASAVISLDAESGEARALITTPETEFGNCDFDVRAALVAAARSAPTILLGAYVLLAAGALLVGRLVSTKGKR